MADSELAPIGRFRRYLKKLRYSYRALPDKKQYVEFFTAVLSVPVLLTVIILNVNNLKGNKEGKEDTKDQAPIVVTVTESKTTPIPQNTTAVCIKGIGPISIDSPVPNEMVDDNPVQISINYDQGDYCAVVWSYSINGGRFSSYSSNSIALYNPPTGTINFQLRVKSVVSGEEKTLSRTFNYQGSTTPTTSPDASASAN